MVGFQFFDNDKAIVIFFQLALSKLVRGNELELAVSIGMVLHDSSSTFHLATELLAKKCERLNRW